MATRTRAGSPASLGQAATAHAISAPSGTLRTPTPRAATPRRAPLVPPSGSQRQSVRNRIPAAGDPHPPGPGSAYGPAGRGSDRGTGTGRGQGHGSATGPHDDPGYGSGGHGGDNGGSGRGGQGGRRPD